MLCGLQAIMTFFKSLKGDHSTAHDEAYTPSPDPPAVREPTYQAPPGPPPSYQLRNPSAHGTPPGGNEYAPPPGPPPGWQRTPNEIHPTPPDADEEPPPYQYVSLESIFRPLDQIFSLETCLGNRYSRNKSQGYCPLKSAVLTARL